MSYFSFRNKGLRAVTRMSVLAAGVAFAGLGAIGLTHAAESAPTKTMPHAMPSTQQRAQFKRIERVRRDLLKDVAQLRQIQSKTLKDHPKLQKQQQAYVAMVTKEMTRRGHSPSKDMAELRALEGKLHDKSISAADHQKLYAQFEQKVHAYEQARNDAMNTPKLQKARVDLEHALLTAMKKEDPKTEGLLKHVKEKSHELQQMYTAAMGGGPAASHKGMAK